MNREIGLPRVPRHMPSVAMFKSGAEGMRAEPWIILPSLIIALIFVLWTAWNLPLLPIMTDDSGAYLEMAGYRPPLYGWLTNGWLLMTGGLGRLPLARLILLGCAVAVFSIELGRLLRSLIVPVLAVPLILLQPVVYDSSKWLLTESPFVALILLGLAMHFRYAWWGDMASLLVAAACFGLAALLRSTGMALLPLPLLVAVLDRRFALGTGLFRAAMAGVVAIGVVLSGMGWAHVRHGHFELGSWAGISLLGKALVLLRPEDAVGMPTAVQAALVAARRNSAEQSDIAATLRAQVQSSGYARLPAFWPTAERESPEWMAADGRGKDMLARAVASDLIAAHPGAYLRLWAQGWLGLIIQPAYWPAWATTVPSEWSAFAFCRAFADCWGLDRYDLPIHGRVILIGAAVAGAILSLTLIPILAWQVLRHRAEPMTVLIWGIALVLHGTLVVTSAVGAGHVRYTVALHVLDITVLLWLLVGPLRRLMRLGAARGVEVLP